MEATAIATNPKRVPHKTITTGMRQQMKQLFEEGKSTSEICKIMDLGRSTVNSNLRAMGIHQRDWAPGVAKVTPEIRQGIVRAYHQGKTREEIMTMFSIGLSTAKLIEKEAKCAQTRAHNKISDKKKKDMCRYYRLGWTYEKIGEAVGLSSNQVAAYISKQGLCNRNASRQDLKRLHNAIQEFNQELITAPLRLDGTPDIRKKTIIKVKKFDDTNVNWSEDMLHNLIFLKSQQGYIRQLLDTKGYLFLSDVYKLLGFPETEESRKLGWNKGMAINFVPDKNAEIELLSKVKSPVELRFYVTDSVNVPKEAEKKEEPKMEAPKFTIKKTVTVEGNFYHYILRDDTICIMDPRTGGEGFAIGTVDRDSFLKEVKELAVIVGMIERGEV